MDFSNLTMSLLLACAAVFSGLTAWIVWLLGRLRDAREELTRASDQLVDLWEMMNTTPEGVFFWDHHFGNTHCSARLSKILGIAPNASLEEMMSAFSVGDAVNLEFDVARLRNQGIGFERRCERNAEMKEHGDVRVSGLRVRNNREEVIADMLWMRAVDAAVETTESTVDHLQTVLDALPIAVWLRDTDLNLTFANAASANKPIPVGAGDLARQAQEQGITVQETLPSEMTDNRVLTISETPLHGGLAGTLGLAIEQNISDDKSENDGQRDATQQAILDHLSEALVVIDSAQNILRFNKAFSALWGLDEDWLRGPPSHGELLDKLHENRTLPAAPDWPARRAELLAQAEDIREPVEEILHLPDGRTVTSVYAPLRDGMVVRIDGDVSDQFDMQRLRNEAEAVRMTTLNKVQEAVAVFGVNKYLTLCNKRFASLWGLPEESEPESTGLHVADFAEIIRRRAVGLSGLRDADWTDKKKQMIARLTDRRSEEGQTILIDGTALRYRYVPLPDGASLISYLDITDGLKMEEALRDRARAFEEADRLKSALIADISHEIRTPLTSITGFAQVLDSGLFGDLDKRQRDYARDIVQKSEEMEALLENITELAAIEAGSATLTFKTLDLHDLLLAAFKLFKPTADRARIETRFDCPPDIGRIDADQDRLRQTVHGLLTRALKSTPQNGRITLSAAGNEEFADISVTNTGAGVQRETVDRILTTTLGETDSAQRPQETEQSADETEHGGVGLTLVTKFVQMHGGNVRISAHPTEGTTVTCRLPYNQAKSRAQLSL